MRRASRTAGGGPCAFPEVPLMSETVGLGLSRSTYHRHVRLHAETGDGASLTLSELRTKGTRPPSGAGSCYEHPAENPFRKHVKSLTFRMGAVVELSQLAYGSPAAKRLRKQVKSL